MPTIADRLRRWRDSFVQRRKEKRHRKEALKAFRKISHVKPIIEGITTLEESRRISYELNRKQLAYSLKANDLTEATATLIDIGELAARDQAIAQDWQRNITKAEKGLIRRQVFKNSLPRIIRHPLKKVSEFFSTLQRDWPIRIANAYAWLISLTSIPSWIGAHRSMQEAYNAPSEENIRKAGIQNIVAAFDTATMVMLTYFTYDFMRDLNQDIFALKAAGAFTMRAVVHKAALALLAKSVAVISVDAFRTSEQVSVEKDIVRMRVVEVSLQALGQKDQYTLGHAERVSEYAEWIARDLGLPEREIFLVKHAAKLHDLGKLGMPDQILFKSGKLTDDEFEQIKMHPLRGYTLASNFTKLDEILLGILMHHEKLNGKGYYGAKGDEIPLVARIISIADIYDALRTDRPYQKGRTHSEAISMLRSFAKNGEVDSLLVEAFITAYSRRMGIRDDALEVQS